MTTEPDSTDHRRGFQTSYPDDISLVDLTISLWKHKWLMISVFLACILAGIAYSFIREANYTYTTTIELGTRITGIDFRVIEDPKNVVAKLENNYIPEAIRIFQREFRQEHDNRIRLSVDASNPQDTELIVLSSRGPEDLRDVYIPLHEHILERLIEDHAKLTNLEKARLQREFDHARIELEELKDDRVQLVERRRKENLIAEARNQLANLVDHETLLKHEIENLDVQAELIGRRLEELATFISQARARRQQTVSEVQSGADGMTLMLIDSEMQRDIDRQNELEERLLVHIPETRRTLRNMLEENQRMQALQRETITSLEGEYEKLLLDQERAIARYEPVYKELELSHANQRETRAILPPRQSLRPVGFSRSIILALSMMLGVILALLAVGTVVLVKSAREQMKG